MYWTKDMECNFYYLNIDRYQLLISENLDSLLIWDELENLEVITIPLKLKGVKRVKKEALEVFINWIREGIEKNEKIIEECLKMIKK